MKTAYLIQQGELILHTDGLFHEEDYALYKRGLDFRVYYSERAARQRAANLGAVVVSVKEGDDGTLS